jgi:hypothetical protein
MKLQFADDDARNITLIVSVISGLLYGASPPCSPPYSCFREVLTLTQAPAITAGPFLLVGQF